MYFRNYEDVPANRKKINASHLPNPDKHDYWVGENILKAEPYYIANGLMNLMKHCVPYVGFSRFAGNAINEEDPFFNGPSFLEHAFSWDLFPQKRDKKNEYTLVVTNGAPYWVGVTTRSNPRTMPLCANCLAMMSPKCLKKH